MELGIVTWRASSGSPVVMVNGFDSDGVLEKDRCGTREATKEEAP